MKKKIIVLLGAFIFMASKWGVAQDLISWENLFDGKTLNGWKQVQGKANYKVRDGAIVGTSVTNSPNSFLATAKNYSDFILELEFKVDDELNSGIQFRSSQDPKYREGIVFGYQVEIDPSREPYSKDPANFNAKGEKIAAGTAPRNWTGGIYDEKRRGWLADLTQNQEARDAFKPKQWNHLRIEASGYRIYTWINGVFAASLVDDVTKSGFIALQVHATTSTVPMEVQWRNIKIKDLSKNYPSLHKSKQNLEKKQTDASVKTSLNAFSFAKLFSSKKMDLFGLIDYAAAHGYDAVDLTGYYFPDYPKIPADTYIFDLKKHAFEKGIEISGTGVRNNFADPNPEKRAADVRHVKEWIDVAAKLGAPVVRVFAGPIPEGYEHKWDEIARYMTASLKECVAYAEQKGVIIGIQNHGDFLKTAEETIKIVKMVDSKWFGVIVDTGYFITEDPYIDIEKIMPYAVNFQVKESPFGVLSRIRIDMPRLMRIVYNSGYKGYLPIETLGDKVMKGQPKPPFPFRPYEPEKLVPSLHKELKEAIAQEFTDNRF
jgi:sugar phosphate isomerase/epimerase